MRNYRLYLSLCFLTLILCGCSKSEIPPIASNHTMLIYMAADNNLGEPDYNRPADDQNNLEKLYRTATKANLGGGRLIIFHDGSGTTPELFEITETKAGKVGKKLLKSYQELNSASASVLGSIIDDVRLLAPATTYGLILWSHATGWLPAGSSYGYAYNNLRSSFINLGIRDPYRISPRMPESIMPKTRAFGQDVEAAGRDEGIEMSDLARVIPDGMFEYILFDACYMGEVEVAYELRNKARYLVASAAEVVAEGMPYDLILKDCFAGNLGRVCQSFYNYYNGKTGWEKSATISLVDCSQMEALATAMSPIAKQYALEIQTLDIAGIQRFDRNPKHTMFDAQDLIDKLIPDPQDVKRKAFESQLDRVVLEKYTTDRVLDQFDVRTFCGLSMYAPISKYSDLNPDYLQTAWYKAVY